MFIHRTFFCAEFFLLYLCNLSLTIKAKDYEKDDSYLHHHSDAFQS